MRSLLITSARTESDVSEAGQSGADALVFDAAGIAAVASIRGRGSRRPLVHVRIGPLVTAPEVGAIVAAAPDGIVLAGAEGRGDVLRLSAMIGAAEAIAGLPDGGIGIVAMIATAPGVLDAASLPGATPRLRGITWDADALAASLGSAAPRSSSGSLIDPCRAARSQCLLAAAAAGIAAFDTAYTDPTEQAALEAEAIDARQQGFAGKLAATPDQVRAINTVFSSEN